MSTKDKKYIFKNYRERLIMILAIIFGIAIGIKSAYILVAFFTVVVSFLTIKHTGMFLKIIIALLLIAPYPYYDYYGLTIPKINISFFEAELLFISIVVCFKYTTDIYNEIKRNKIYLLFFSILIMYTFVGLRNINPFIKSDIRQYYIIMLYIVFVVALKEDKNILKSIIKLSIISSFFLSVLVIVMFIFKSSLFDPMLSNKEHINSTRVGFGNQAFFVFTAPLIFLALKIKILDRKWSLISIFTLITIVLSLLIDETRSLVIATTGNIVIIYIYTLITDKKRKLTVKIFEFATILITIVVLGNITVYYFSNVPKIKAVVERFSEINSKNTIKSAEVRNITNKRSMEIISKNPIGYGLGSSFNLVNTNGRLAKDAPFVDNFFITTLNKFGILGFIIFILFYLRCCYQIYVISQKADFSTAKIMFGFLLCIPLSIVHNCIYTAQLIVDTPNAVYILLLYAVVSIIYFQTTRTDIRLKKWF